MDIKTTTFSEILTLIHSSKQKAFAQVNSTLIELYWNIGQYISTKTIKENWGKGVVKELADYIKLQDPSMTGFTARSLWRMKQFYETYKENEKVSALLTQLTWTNHLLILSASKSQEEREFYILLASQARYSSRELERQIKSGMSSRSHRSRWECILQNNLKYTLPRRSMEIKNFLLKYFNLSYLKYLTLILK